MAERLQQLLEKPLTDSGAAENVEAICGRLIAALRQEGLSAAEDTFLLPHGMYIASRITNVKLRQEDPWIK